MITEKCWYILFEPGIPDLSKKHKRCPNLLNVFICFSILQPLVGCDDANVGFGRTFSTKIRLENAIKAVQKHIGLDVHVALGVEHSSDTEIQTVAVCAGSGGSLLRGVKADLYITGEMSHHEVLDANHDNVSVILCNHSNSERGFLRTFKPQLEDMLNGQCEVIVSETDEDPLKTHVKASDN